MKTANKVLDAIILFRPSSAPSRWRSLQARPEELPGERLWRFLSVG